ncbi:MAG: UDP-N-acetylmuramoyl-L-alanine--D-glutamate ligase [Sterolibacterium sp.]|nr:UDP-N-acetylmuramoyl-L-alanine--D-glutamate ligase [Sterolibacterium sp.]
MSLNGLHVLILGLGESGLAMARWCARQGARLRVADTRATPPGLAQLQATLPAAEFVSGAFDKALLSGIDLLAISPGLSAGQMVVFEACARGIRVAGEIELFAEALRDLGVRERCKVIAITGTNGKTTTTALTAHLCAAAGRDVALGGNISPAALDALMARLDAGQLPEIWVLELSSFQLETMETLHPDAAAVLNVSDDHLDRYIDLEEYASAKARILAGCGVQVLNRQDARVRRMALADRRLFSFGLDAPGDVEDFGLRQRKDGAGGLWLVQGEQFLLPMAQLPIPGLHNAANALAALALCHALGLPLSRLVSGLQTFKGLPHRVEFVAESEGVRYYDDSKGTNVGASIAGLGGLGGQMIAASAAEAAPRVVLIAGGDGKGQDFSPLAQTVAEYARAVVLIGRDAALIATALQDCGVPLRQAGSMMQAVALAAAEARPGDAVLLSPACASFDMYRNYVHRAQEFIAAVAALMLTRRQQRGNDAA